MVTCEKEKVLLVDLDFKNTPREKACRARKARFDPLWHEGQMRVATKNENWFAATFHYAWLLNNDPDNSGLYDGLHDSNQKRIDEYGPEQKKDLEIFLPKVIKDALKLPRPKPPNASQVPNQKN